MSNNLLLCIPKARVSPLDWLAGGQTVSIPSDAFASHVLSWPGGNVIEPDPFATGVAADNRRFPKWSKHEPTQGDFHWTDDFYNPGGGYYVNPEFAVVRWRDEGKKTLLVLKADEDRPAWADANNDAAWAAWVTAAITRWRPAYVEFVNEPSTRSVDITWLVRMYSIAYPIAHAIDPAIVVIGPSCESISTPGNGVEYTVSFLQAGGDAYIDALGIHLYPHGLANHEPRSIVDQMAWLHSQVDSLWTGPIYATEQGCTPENFPSQTKETQLRWFWQTNMLPVLLGCRKSWWYGWGEDNYGPYLSAYLADIRALWATIASFAGHTVSWKVRADGRLDVVREDGLWITY